MATTREAPVEAEENQSNAEANFSLPEFSSLFPALLLAENDQKIPDLGAWEWGLWIRYLLQHGRDQRRAGTERRLTQQSAQRPRTMMKATLSTCSESMN